MADEKELRRIELRMHQAAATGWRSRDIVVDEAEQLEIERMREEEERKSTCTIS